MRAEVLIIGGGPAGATAALLLARGGREVLLLEKAAFPRRKVCGEFIAAAGLGLLDALGLLPAVAGRAGPDIRAIALWAGREPREAPMPAAAGRARYPRALEREALDALLLDEARRAGVRVLQPCAAHSLLRLPGRFLCRAAERRGAPETEIEARAVIAAHGSWEPGALPTQPPHLAARGDDVLGFQAHFVGAGVPRGRIVLAPFAGGYAGLVERGGGASTLACCVRRDVLERARKDREKAADTLFADVLMRNSSLENALRHAVRQGTWLGAGPLRPGTRALVQDGVLVIGNAAGEAHPVVGEGITLGMQSAALLAPLLARALHEGWSPRAARGVALRYAWRWRLLAAWRLRASASFAWLSMSPRGAGAADALLGRAPALLTLAARVSGKFDGTLGRA